jgi:hypothetical protein
MSWVDRGRDAGRLLKEVDVKDLLERLDAVRDYLRDLTATFRVAAEKPANQRTRTRPRPRPRK